MIITDTHVYFYATKDLYSNFYPLSFYDEDIRCNFNCSEQDYMFRKSSYFLDFDTCTKILQETVPAKQKALGRSVVGFDNEEWDLHKEEAMFYACYYKFKNNEEARDQLLFTDDKILVEAAGTNDLIWGCGLREKDSRILDEANWTGLNLLGKTLVKVRECLKLDG